MLVQNRSKRSWFLENTVKSCDVMWVTHCLSVCRNRVACVCFVTTQRADPNSLHHVNATQNRADPPELSESSPQAVPA